MSLNSNAAIVFATAFMLANGAFAQRQPPALPSPEAGTLSNMPFASTPFDGSEIIYIVQGGISKKTNLSNFSFDTAGNYVWTGSWTFNGPMVFGNPSAVRGALGAAASGLNGDITGFTGLTAPLSTLNGSIMGTVFPAVGSNPTGTASAASRANHVINIHDDYGSRPDTLNANCTPTTTAGQAAFTLASCTNFVTGAPVTPTLFPGEKININYAGALLTTSPVATIPLATHGDSYRDIPTVTVTDATGTGAYAYANMELNAFSLKYGGAGCLIDGPGQILTITDGIYSIQASVSATVTGGVVTSIDSIVNAGSFQAFLNPANMLTPHSIFLSGAGCTSQPIIDATFDVASLTFVSGGQNYTAPTASISDGNATLGALTLSAPVANMLSTTVATVTGPLTGTLTDVASQTLNKSEYIVFGGRDNATSIQSAFNDKATAGLAGGPVSIPVPPPGYCYGVASTVAIPDTYPIAIRGGGPGSEICAMTAINGPVVSKGSGFMFWGSTFEDFTINANKLATNAYLGGCNTTQRWVNVDLKNAAPYGTIHSIGPPSTCSGGTYVNVKATVDRNIYSGHSDLPLICQDIRNTDVDWTNGKAIGCSLYGTRVNGGAGSHFTNHHNSSTDQMTNCFEILSATVTLTNPECDRGLIIGIHAAGAHFIVQGGLINTASGNNPPPVRFGVLVENNLKYVDIKDFDASDVVLQTQRVAWNGMIGQYSASVNQSAWPTFEWGKPSVLCQGVKTTLATGYTTENSVLDCPIPGGIISFNGKIAIDAGWSMTGPDTSDRYNIRLGDPQADPVSATFVYGVTKGAQVQNSPVTISIATPGVITWPSHGLAADTAVVFNTTGALPTGLTAGVTTYYVISTGLSINAFQVAATVGGSAIATSGTQSGNQTAASTSAYQSLWQTQTIQANNANAKQVTIGPITPGFSTTDFNTAATVNMTTRQDLYLLTRQVGTDTGRLYRYSVIITPQ